MRDGNEALLFSRSVFPASADFSGFPLSVPISAKRGDERRTFSLQTTALSNRRLADGSVVVSTLAHNRVRTGFRSGRVMRMTLWLISGCRCNLETERCEPDADGDLVPECVPQTVDLREEDAGIVDAGVSETGTSEGGTGPMCTSQQRICEGRCVSLNSPAACGPSCNRCSAIPGGTALCDNNVCGIECSTGTPDRCPSACVNLENDAANCGTCGNACANGQLCVNRVCQAPPQCTMAQDVACTGATFCNLATRICAPGCDGQSGQCSTGQRCNVLSHVCECAEGTTMCGDVCVVCPSGVGILRSACSGNSCVVEQCVVGYQANGLATACSDINECDINNGGCFTGVLCTNTPGGRACGACPRGYIGNGETCTDVNECDSNNGGCPANQNCSNLPGSFSCSACPSGFEPNGQGGCRDINECNINNGGCGVGTCSNVDGSFSCACNAPNRSCSNMCVTCPSDSNATGTSCSNGSCILSGCNAGYQRSASNTQCLDVNECNTNNGGCGAGVCANAPGSFACSCDAPNQTCGGVCVGCPLDPQRTATGCNGSNACTITSCAIGFMPNAAGSACEAVPTGPFTGARIPVLGSIGEAQFGHSAALSDDGNTLVIGDHDGGFAQYGSALVWTRSAGTWGNPYTIVRPDDSYDFGWSVALSADGNTLVVSDTGRLGSVFGYVRTSGTWSRGTQITAPTGAQSFGQSLSLSADGNTLAVGDDEAAGGGAVHLFLRSNGTWRMASTVSSRSGARFFGYSVSVSGDGNTLAVGDTRGGGDSGGAVAVFTQRAGEWSADSAPARPAGAGTFGSAISLSRDGNTLVVGATGGGSGTATLFVRSGGTWRSDANLLGPEGTIGFGGSASMSRDGNTCIVGGFGHAIVFFRSNGVWGTSSRLLAPTGHGAFGNPVRVSGDGNTVVVGGYNGNGGTSAFGLYSR